MKNSIEKLALGTVQFGVAYGVTNNTGLPSVNEVEGILKLARSAGIDLLDTAPSYGCAGKRLGCLGVLGMRVVSKVSINDLKAGNIDDHLDHQISTNLNELNLTTLDAVLVHDPAKLMSNKGCDVWKKLSRWKENGLVKKIGYSVYDPMELEALFVNFPPDVVQLPMSVADRRFEISGWLHQLKEKNVETHVRSIFLQGLLLDDTFLPKIFKKTDFFECWEKWIDSTGVSRLSLCLKYVLQSPLIDRVLVGVQSTRQLMDIIDAASIPNEVKFPEELFIEQSILLNPSNWTNSEAR